MAAGSQYWEVWFADDRIVTSAEYDLHDIEQAARFPLGRVVAVLQPGAHERTGWKDALRTTNHIFFRTDLDCWTEHDPSPLWACLEMVEYAHVISCYRMGKWVGDYPEIRERYEARLLELMSDG